MKSLTNKEIKRELQYGELLRFARYLQMTPNGLRQRLKNNNPRMNLYLVYQLWKTTEEGSNDK